VWEKKGLVCVRERGLGCVGERGVVGRGGGGPGAGVEALG